MAEDLAHAHLASRALVGLIRAAIDAGRARDAIDVHEAWLRDLEMWGSRDSATISFDELKDAERQLRIGLGYWTIRAARHGNDAASPIFRYLASTFASPVDALEALGRALRTGIESDEWLDWVEPPRFGGNYSPAVDLELLQSGLAMCAVLILNGSESGLEPIEWLPLRLDTATNIVRDFSTPSWQWLFGGVSNLDGVISNLIGALEIAAREQRNMETERVRQAPISGPLESDLYSKLLEAWQRLSIVRSLFFRAKRLETKVQEGPTSALRVARGNLFRSFLTEGSTGESNEFIAAEIGRLLARSELELLVSRAADAHLSDDSHEALTARLEAALERVDAPLGGTLALLMPVNPLVEIELGLRKVLGPGQDDSPFFGAAGVGHWYRGTVRDTPVIQYRAVPRDRVIVLGYAWAHYIEWTPNEEPVRIELTDVPGEPPGSTEPQVELTVSRYSDIVIDDDSKATAFRIDDLELRFA